MNALADTLVIIVADHGESHGDHGYMGHSFGAQQELVHVPLLVLDPAGRCAAGQRVSAAVSTRRIFHTALAAAGLSAPLDEADPEADVAGLTLARAAEGCDSDGPVFSEAWPPETLLALLRRRNPELLRRRRLGEVRRAMHSGRHKLLLCGDDVEALYDLQDDPREQQRPGGAATAAGRESAAADAGGPARSAVARGRWRHRRRGGRHPARPRLHRVSGYSHVGRTSGSEDEAGSSVAGRAWNATVE